MTLLPLLSSFSVTRIYLTNAYQSTPLTSHRFHHTTNTTPDVIYPGVGLSDIRTQYNITHFKARRSYSDLALSVLGGASAATSRSNSVAPSASPSPRNFSFAGPVGGLICNVLLCFLLCDLLCFAMLCYAMEFAMICYALL
jgi:hypothetical protein